MAFGSAPSRVAKTLARILGEHLVDLVVLDLKLAEEDGLQLVNELKRNPVCRSSSQPATGVTKSTASSASSLAQTII